MMHSTCINSAISLRCKGSLSLSFNDCNYFLDDRFDRNPIFLSPSSCCCCCANSIYRLPINPSILYGLRQSTLIQWSPCKRLILNGMNRCYSRFSVSDLDRNYCYEKFYSFKERSVNGKKGRWGKGRYGRTSLEERSKGHLLSNVDEDVEVMLSLLTEEVGEECFGFRERNGRSSRRVQVEKRENGDGTCYYKSRKKNVGSGDLESASKGDYEFVTYQSREEDKRQKEDRREEERENYSRSENLMAGKEGRREEERTNLLRSDNRRTRKEDRREEESTNFSRSENHSVRKEDRREEESTNFLRSENRRVRKEDRREEESTNFLRSENRRVRKEDRSEEESINFSRSENRRARKEGSSCSSYYSLSSAGEFESDNEVEARRDGFMGESFNEHKRDRKGNEEIRYDGEVMEKVDRRQDYVEEHGIVLKKENTAEGLYGESNGVDHDWRKKSEKKLSEVAIEQTDSRKELAEGAGYAKSSNLHRHYDDRQEKSTLPVNINEGTRQQHNQKGDRITGESESRMKYKQFTEMPEICIETTSSSLKRYSNTEKNLSASVGLVQETTGKHSETAGHVTRQDEYRRNSQQIAELSEVQEIYNRGASSSVSGTRMKNWEDNSTMVLDLVDDTEEKHQKPGQLVSRQTGSRVKSQQITGISDTHDITTESTSLARRKSEIRMKKLEENSDMAYPEAKVIDAQRLPQTRTSSQERYTTSVVKSIEETRERHNLTDKGVLQIESRKDARRPTKASSFQQGISKEATSSHKSLKLNPQSIAQQIGADDGDKRSSRPIVTAQSSDLVARGPLHVEPAGEFSSVNLKSGANELHVQTQENVPGPRSEIYGRDRRGDSHGVPLDFIAHEDAIGSADRLQKSSMHFVGEFVEKVRHEVSTSEVQKEKKTRETKLVYEDEQHKQKSQGQDGSGNSHPKDHDSRRSSQGSGPKGPSDEMWHVTDPSVQEPPETNAPERTISTTGSEVVKRTGRSLWNIIGDIVRMRWALSRSETHTSKSGGRSSPNQSTSSEAWFSGHDPDENNDENVKTNQTIMPQEGILSRSRGEASSSKNKVGHVGVDSTSLSKTGSGSTDKIDISSSSVEGTSSGGAIVESSFPLPSIRMRRSFAVKDNSWDGQTDASGSSTMAETEQPVPAHLTEVSVTEAKDGELKRRKLQRKDHVPKDSFDEWEEVHTLETEQRKIDEMFMREAILEARKGADLWEVPVGAVLVRHGKIIARGYNLVEDLRDSTAHAEMICIREASKTLRTWRLSETTLYVTLEPCPMCAGAILQARIDTVVWGAPNKLLGADGSWIRLFPNGAGGNGLELTDKPAAPVHPFHPNIIIRRGVLSSECADVMQQFFQLRRKKKEKKTEPPTPPTPPTPPSCLPISHHPSKFLTKMHNAFNIMFCL